MALESQHDIDQDQRIAACERRLDALEGKTKPTAAPAATPKGGSKRYTPPPAETGEPPVEE